MFFPALNQELGHLAQFPPYQCFTVLIKLLVSCKQVRVSARRRPRTSWRDYMSRRGRGLGENVAGEKESWSDFRQVEANRWMDANGSKQQKKVSGSSETLTWSTISRKSSVS